MTGEFKKGQTRDEKIDKFLDTMAWHFSEKSSPTGFYRTIGRIDEKLGSLINTLEKADESSTQLTKALNNITKWGVIIAGLGLFVAVANLVFEVFKYFS